jgi:hypothetical protein
LDGQAQDTRHLSYIVLRYSKLIEPQQNLLKDVLSITSFHVLVFVLTILGKCSCFKTAHFTESVNMSLYILSVTFLLPWFTVKGVLASENPVDLNDVRASFEDTQELQVLLAFVGLNALCEVFVDAGNLVEHNFLLYNFVHL